MRRRDPFNQSTPAIGAFFARLSASIDLASDRSRSQLSSVRALLEQGDDGTGFLDNTLESIVQRCTRITTADQCVSFLVIVHYMQLVCKTSKSVKHIWSLRLLI